MTPRRPLDNILKPLIYHFASSKFVVTYNYVPPLLAISTNRPPVPHSREVRIKPITGQPTRLSDPGVRLVDIIWAIFNRITWVFFIKNPKCLRFSYPFPLNSWPESPVFSSFGQNDCWANVFSTLPKVIKNNHIIFLELQFKIYFAFKLKSKSLDKHKRVTNNYNPWLDAVLT